MKKLLSVLLVFCMIFSVSVMPATAVDTAESTAETYEETTLGSYYKFTFGEDGDRYNYVTSYTTDTSTAGQVSYKNNTFYPLWHGYKDSASYEYKTVTDVDTGIEYDTIEIATNGDVQFTPLTSGGQPFELTPGKLYQVTYEFFNPRAGAYSRVRVSGSGNDTKDFFSKTTQGVNISADGTITTATKDIWAPYEYNVHMNRIAGGSAQVYFTDGSYGVSTTFGNCVCDAAACSHKSRSDLVYCSGSAYLSVPEANSYYDTENKRYDVKLITAGSDTEDTSDDVYSDNNNYFTFRFRNATAVNPNGTAATYGNADDETVSVQGAVQIVSIEIREVGTGATKLHLANGETDIITGEIDSKMPLYIPEAPAGQYFYGWYTDKELTTRCTAFNFTDGVTELYACFRDYCESTVEDYESVPKAATQFSIYKSTEVKFAEGAYDEETVAKYTTTSTTTFNDTFVLNGYNASTVSGGVQLSGTTYNRSGSVLISNDDNSLFVPAPNAKYKVTVSCRATQLEDGDSIALAIGYGIGREDHGDTIPKIDGKYIYDINGNIVYSSYFNSAEKLFNTEFDSLTDSQSVSAVTDEFNDYTFTVETYDLDEEKYQSVIGIWDTIPMAASGTPNQLVIDTVKIELIETTVTFIGADGTTTIDTKSGIPGEPLELPDTGIIDTNWYTDYEKNEVYSSAVFPEEDIILYAAPLNNGITEKYYSGLYYSAGTTTDENGEAVPTLYYDGSKGILTGGPTVHYRLGTVEDQVSYKVSFSYKADEITNGTNISFATADPKNASNLVMMVEGAKGVDALYVINAENTTVGEWNTVDIFFTANLNGYIAPTGIYGDYEFTSLSANNSNNGLFLMLSEVTNGTDKIHFKDFTVTSLGYALEATGASLLTGKAETISGGQAIRYFFDYKTSDGFYINLGGTDYKIVERGVIFRDGAEPKYYDNDGANNVKIKDRKPNTTLSFSDNAELKVVASDSAKLNNCWEYNDADQMMTYSYYVHGFETDDSKKLMARGYVTFEDGKGNQFTVYSAETTRSVELMKAAMNITY